MSQMVQHDDQPPLAIVNKVGQPQVASIMNFQIHMFSLMMVPTWFEIQNILVGWNPILINGHSIPTLPKFITYHTRKKMSLYNYNLQLQNNYKQHK
jgi:hypothetical protein